MNNQEQQKGSETNPQARGLNDVPQEEQTRNVGDDEEAKSEHGEDVVSRAAMPSQWRAAQCVLTLKEQINAKAPNRSKLSDGVVGDQAHWLKGKASDHNPWVTEGSLGIVTAMDITNDPAGGCDANALAEAIRASRDARVKYIIWNRRIASSSSISGQPAWAWRPYTGANPHNKHVHISVLPEKSKYDSTVAWGIDVIA